MREILGNLRKENIELKQDLNRKYLKPNYKSYNSKVREKNHNELVKDRKRKHYKTRMKDKILK